MRLSAYYDEVQCQSEDIIKYTVAITEDGQDVACYGVEFDMSTDVCQINIELPLEGVPRHLAMPLLFSCIREIIGKEVSTLSVHYDCDYTATRNRNGRLIISGCGYSTCATVDEKEYLIKILVMKDAIGDIRILEMAETECTILFHNKTHIKDQSAYKEVLVDYLTEQCLSRDSAYYRPKHILQNGSEGLNSMSVSELEEDVKLWFGNSGIGIVRDRLATKVNQ